LSLKKKLTNKHVAAVHEGKNPSNMTFVTTDDIAIKSDLKKHVAFVHEVKKPFKCDICEL
jgi:hypothetical protein